MGNLIGLPYLPIVLGQAVTWERCFIQCFLRVPQLYCRFPAAQTSKGNSQKIVYKTSYPGNSLFTYPFPDIPLSEKSDPIHLRISLFPRPDVATGLLSQSGCLDIEGEADPLPARAILGLLISVVALFLAAMCIRPSDALSILPLYPYYDVIALRAPYYVV